MRKRLEKVFYVIDIDDEIEIIYATDVFERPIKGDQIIINKDAIPKQDVEIKNFIDQHGSVYTVDKIKQDYIGDKKDGVIEQCILVILKPKIK